MGVMMMDDRFDETLREAARDYNDPPPTPRDAMWARIEAARAGSSTVVPLHRRVPRWGAWTLGLAAMLMIGIAIGRLTRIDSPGTSPVAVTTPPPPAARTDTARAAEALPVTRDNETQRAQVAAGVEDRQAPRVASGAPPSGEKQILPPGARRTVPRTDTRAAPRRDSPAPRVRSAPMLAERSTRADTMQANLPYRFAAMQHLSRAEALLTSFEEDTRAGRQDEQMRVWASDLLSSTRLLLDSPAGRDARMRPLLEDLELVLAQIRQAAEGRTSERDMVVEGIDARGVLPRIRTAIPAGPVPVGT
jgi:hypothetical protein